MRSLLSAAGTGVLTRQFASQLPAQARIVATDLNQPMLDIAAAKQGDASRVERRQADALALPFADQSFDAVACRPDRVDFAAMTGLAAVREHKHQE